jgi:hypothetical protein
MHIAVVIWAQRRYLKIRMRGATPMKMYVDLFSVVWF